MKAAIALLILFIASPLHAEITWLWANSLGTGTEQGTFVTDGGLVEGQAPAGAYTLADFSVTASAVGLPLGSIAAGDYETTWGGTSNYYFYWDGSEVTQYRLGNNPTIAYHQFRALLQPGGAPDLIQFWVFQFDIYEQYGDSFLFEDEGVVVTPAGTPTATGTVSRIKLLYP